MRYDTATRRLTKRAKEFLGISFGHYLAHFTHLREHEGEHYIWLNDNATMQKTLEVWLSNNGNRQKLIDFHLRARADYQRAD